MKRIFVLTALLISFSGFSQSFTLAELIKITKSSDDNFDTYATLRGFTFYSNETDDTEVENQSYVYKSNDVKIAYLTKYSFLTNKYEKSSMVSFQTINSSAYLKIKNELKANGFKFLNKDLHNGTTFLNYSKGKIEISLASSSDESNGSYRQRTSYEISVSILNE